MSVYNLYITLTTLIILCAPIIFWVLLSSPAKYGRYIQSKKERTITKRMGWILMEFPSPIVMMYFFTHYPLEQSIPYIFFILWETHYIYRTFIYPFRLNSTHDFPIRIVLYGMLFNTINAAVNGISLTLIHIYPTSWLFDPRFIIGVVLFIIGFSINLHADKILLKLRQVNDAEYKIPYGGLYQWVSCPNYFGEIIEWLGWAIATWSLAGFAFAIFTFSNLVPRALAHHRWYLSKFPNYPQNRRAIIFWLL